VGRMNKYLVRSLNLGEILINEGPKVFAARIGLTLSALALVSFIAGFNLAAYILGGILVFFSFLEAVFGFCVACKIYPIFFRQK
jgi:hypothetical protein